MADPQVNIIISKDSNALARKAAELLVDTIGVLAFERVTVALSGGSTPKVLYQILSGDEYKDKVAWDRVEIFFSDERVVPDDDANSNYKLAYDGLLSKVPIPENHVHRVNTELGDPEQVAADYENDIKTYFSQQQGDTPRFDIILLGLGDDGHTASLFPGKPAVDVTDKLVTSSPPGVLPPPVDRVTFTFPLINAASTVVFLAAGAGKADILSKILNPAPDQQTYPAQKVQPTNGRVIWMLDEAAAANLSDEVKQQS